MDTNTIRLGIIGIVVAFLQFVGIGIQAYFLLGTLRATAKAADAAKEAADAALSLERPHLLVSTMKVVQRTDLPKDHYTCEYQIMNYGRSPAILNFSSVDLSVLQGLPAAPPYRQLRPWADKLAYPKEPVGENELISITPDEDSPHIASDLEGYDLFFFGYFIFYDVFGKRRKTGFCYKIDPGIGGFFRMRLPAYDYDIEEDQ